MRADSGTNRIADRRPRRRPPIVLEIRVASGEERHMTDRAAPPTAPRRRTAASRRSASRSSAAGNAAPRIQPARRNAGILGVPSSRVARQPARVLHAVVEQHRVRFGDRVVAEPAILERIGRGACTRSAARAPARAGTCCQSVWPPCGRSTRYTSSGTRTGAQNARDRFPSRSPVSNMIAPAAVRIDAHLAHLLAHRPTPSRFAGKCASNSRRAEQRERVGARRLAMA